MSWSATGDGAAIGSRTRIGLDWLRQAMFRATAAVEGLYRSSQTGRALMEMEDWQREDCGINRPDIPTRSQIEAAARHRLSDGMPSDWC